VVLAGVHLEYPGDESTVVVRTDPDGSEQRWNVLGRLAGRDMPPVVATADGGALLWMYDPYLTPDGPAVLYDLRPDGSGDTFLMGTYQYSVALHASRFIVVLDGAYIRLALP